MFCDAVKLIMDKDLVTKRVQLVLEGNYWQAIETLLKELPNDNHEGEVELSHVTYSYFKGEGVAYRYAPFNSLYIDTIRKNIQMQWIALFPTVFQSI